MKEALYLTFEKPYSVDSGSQTKLPNEVCSF